MITKRKFLSMTLMMFVLWFMFQFSQVMKESGNEYDFNEYAVNAEEGGRDEWQPSPAGKEQDDKYTIFIGEGDSDIGKTVKLWCTYTKRRLAVCRSVQECPGDVEKNAEFIVLEEEYVAEQADLLWLAQRAENGMTLIFCNLPEPSEIAESKEWQSLLGIKEVMADEVALAGVNLFAGFLLGGQEIYLPEDEEEERERQDLDLKVPWYLTGNGCKTYMVGMLDDTSVKNEELPALVWRAGVGEGKVFAVNGSYMEDCTGIGMLDAMAAEANPYTVYPVVNAQNLSVANFPGLASENNEAMEGLYSRNQLAVFRDILWPGLCSAIQKSGAHLTCYLSPQSDYGDGNEPSQEQLVFYLKQLKEKGAEAGLTTEYISAGSLPEKWRADEAFFQSAGSMYRYGAVYVTPEASRQVWMFQKYDMLQHIQTITGNYEKGQPVVSYKTDGITWQSVTSTGITHTYSEDMRMKSLQTALGYSNIVLDMNQISWPKEEGDRWELVSEEFSSNINTYWKAFEMFSQTSASESDRRIRTFLGMDYEDSREGNEIRIRMRKKSSGAAWFILRTHGEEIRAMEGGGYEEIEADAYLIRADEDEVKIQCGVTDQLHYYLP